MDETSLCWRFQVDNSLATHQLEGWKINKERITFVICANSDSNKKISLTIISKHLNPRCFKGINRDTLGARYHANAKAWMTQDVFRLWLLDFDCRMQGRQVLLLLDNCPGHPLGEVCGDERGPSQHPCFLPTAKHDLGSPTLQCWDHTHIQSILQKVIQQPTSGWLREQHRQSRKDQHSGCVPPSSPSLGGGCFAYHNRQLLPPLQNPDHRLHPHTTRGSWSSHRPYPGVAASSGSASIRESHGHLQSFQLSRGKQLHGGVK